MKLKAIGLILLFAFGCRTAEPSSDVHAERPSIGGSQQPYYGVRYLAGGELMEHFAPPTPPRSIASLACKAPTNRELNCLEAPVADASSGPGTGQNRNPYYGFKFADGKGTLNQYFAPPTPPKLIAHLTCSQSRADGAIVCLAAAPSTPSGRSAGANRSPYLAVHLKLTAELKQYFQPPTPPSTVAQMKCTLPDREGVRCLQSVSAAGGPGQPSTGENQNPYFGFTLQGNKGKLMQYFSAPTPPRTMSELTCRAPESDGSLMCF